MTSKVYAAGKVALDSPYVVPHPALIFALADCFEKAHLAGAAFGAAYAYSNADYYLWRTLVRFFSGENNNKSRPKPPAQLDGTADLSLDQLVDRLNSSE
jgi:hypothetical protein